ncbi:MAG: hypothetical protein K2K31_01535, partial [Clostridia bacterium]|nr:hypothetical protein [Clostridia bacterium]
LEQIQKTAKNSCDRKIRRIQINNMRRAKVNLDLQYVGKLSLSAKRFSIYRHKIEKGQSIEQKKVENDENKVKPTFKDTMFAQENPNYVEHVKKNEPERKNKAKHISVTLNLSELVK